MDSGTVLFEVAKPEHPPGTVYMADYFYFSSIISKQTLLKALFMRYVRRFLAQSEIKKLLSTSLVKVWNRYKIPQTLLDKL